MDLQVFAVPGLPDVSAGADLARVDRRRRQIGAGLSPAPIIPAMSSSSRRRSCRRPRAPLVRLDEVAPSSRATRVGGGDGQGPASRRGRASRVAADRPDGSGHPDRRNAPRLRVRERGRGRLECAARVRHRAAPRSGRVRRPAAGARSSEAFACPVGVIVADTFGRPWREGVVNVALGVAGLRPLVDYRGVCRIYGRRLEAARSRWPTRLPAPRKSSCARRRARRSPIVRGACGMVGRGTGSAALRARLPPRTCSR